MKKLEYKAIEILNKFIEEELEEFTYLSFELDDAYSPSNSKEVRLSYNFSKSNSPESWISIDFRIIFNDYLKSMEDANEEDCLIEIDLHEDSWQEIASYDWKVKYFWIALLNKLN